MNAESNQFVALRFIHTRRTNSIDEFRRHSMNLESNQLVRVQPLQILRFDIPGEFQADIVDGHRPLLLAVDSSETERLHLLRILRVSDKMKQAGALAVPQKTFAFEFPRVPRDRKLNFLPPRLGKIQSRKIAGRPLRAGMKMMSGA